VYLAQTRRGRGVGRLLLERLITEIKSLGYLSLFAGIALPDVASIRLHETLGFRRVGVFANLGFKLGAWHDVGWWCLPLTTPPPVDPDEPLEWSHEV
jgi:phosphinothricin acetyltransferase